MNLRVHISMDDTEYSGDGISSGLNGDSFWGKRISRI